MTTPWNWATLSAGAAGELIAPAVRLAAAGWADAGRIARVVARRLESGLACPAAAVIWDLVAAADTRRRLPSLDEAAAVGAQLARAGARVHVVGEPGYPGRLHDAWPELGAPVWLFVRSRTGQLPAGPAVAVVGTRQPSADGLRTAENLGRLLGRAGVTVISGMARGIDQAAHRGALRAEATTVAVLGTGLDVDYPSGDAPLREEVAACGGLVTELAPGAEPRPRHFPARNRIISGMADVTVVVEGRGRSGALQTARLAASQGREVLAVPGSINAPVSRAPLDLIRDGARVLTRLEDVLDVLDELPPRAAAAWPSDNTGAAAPAPRIPCLEPPAATVYALLGAVPATPSELAGAADMDVAGVLAAVGELTLRGLAIATPSGLVRGSGARL